MKLYRPLDSKFPISQKWGENPAYYNTIGLNGHNGWDYACPVGTPIFAAHDGTVWFAGIDPTLSNTIAIDTTDGLYRTFYAHLSSFSVLNGQSVKCGDQIGLSGNSGRYTTGPHLHFGIHHIKNYSDVDIDNGWNGAVDPLPYFEGLTRNLLLGSQGEDVRVLQDFLKAKGFLTINETTQYFGFATMKSLIAFQRANKLSPAVGFCGNLTRGSINPLI